MAVKRELSKSPTPDRTDIDRTETQPENPPKSSTCRICGDQARIINYGTLSCQSCKTFFRRNGFRPETVRPCNINNSCEINMETRHSCTACRLAKCFAMGMSSDLIRKEDYTKLKSPSSRKSNTNEPTISTQLTTASQGSIFDLLQGDRSLLFESQWTLLSNIVHAYDTYSNISRMRDTIDSLSTLSPERHVNMMNPLEIISQMYTSMQLFISSSPDFRILTLSEQISLFERNLHVVGGFYSTHFLRHTGILQSPEYLQAFTTIYGPDIMSSVKQAIEELDSDSTLIKIILMIFAFSSSCLIVNTNEKMERDSLLYGTFRLLGSQNVYVELLWKYMIYQYGYDESALRFTRLMKIFLCVIKHVAIVHANNESHRKMVDDVVEKTKQNIVTNTNEQTPLWGKDLII